MDIAALSMAISLQNVNNDAGVLMLSKSLDTLEETGDNMVKMMEQSVTPQLGSNFDVSV